MGPNRTYTIIAMEALSLVVFFLIDFCYVVNLATVVYLLWFPNDVRVEALVYALADGPVAGALVAWQCPWLFGSAEHTVSVLMHLLPGLAVFAHRYYTPSSLRGWRGMRDSGLRLLQHKAGFDSVVQPAARPSHLALWLVVAPLLFYMVWQLFYFLVVQVLFRSFILRHGYDTSYTCLARRAAKTNNVWNRLVRKGSIMRRCAMYGALQLAFTVICCLVFLTTYFCFPLAFLLQVVKFVFPIYYGSKYEKTKVPQHVFLKGMQHLDVVRQQQTAGKEEQAPKMVSAATVELCASVPTSPEGLRLRSSCAAEVVQLQPLMPRPVYA
eukprot:gene9226-9391_t